MAVDVGPGGLQPEQATVIRTNEYSREDGFDYLAAAGAGNSRWFSLTATVSGTYSIDMLETTGVTGGETGIITAVSAGAGTSADVKQLASQAPNPGDLRARYAYYIPAGSTLVFQGISVDGSSGDYAPSNNVVRVAGPAAYVLGGTQETFLPSNIRESSLDVFAGPVNDVIPIPSGVAVGDFVIITIPFNAPTDANVNQSAMTEAGYSSIDRPTSHFFFGRISNLNPIPITITAPLNNTIVARFYRTDGDIIYAAKTAPLPNSRYEAFAWDGKIVPGRETDDPPIMAAIAAFYIQPETEGTIFGQETSGRWKRQLGAFGVGTWVDNLHWEREAGGTSVVPQNALPGGEVRTITIPSNRNFHMRAVFFGITLAAGTTETWEWPELWEIIEEPPVIVGVRDTVRRRFARGAR